ncbi:LCP family protein [Jeotgalibacillus salarius]|uniref:LytR family transcriptional regulator n=1 Tax=Jeotgalibacillus salarius TaxID=546023 RepID=A0A4Y8LLU2_9BACL|nr:LCP family protein [Jeotgalibacillus salarius]TFE03974.1 LytR family transcriptional regulator [Jeotgalibacillus salarius]
MDRKTYKKKAKARRVRKRVLMIGLPLLLIAVSGLVYGGYLYTKAQNVADDSFEAVEGRAQSDLRDKDVNPDVDNVSVLFLGVDGSDVRESAEGFENGTTRTDAIILATLNNDDKSVKLTSIPRDTLAYIPEVDYQDKINHAHAFGGPRASMEAVEELLDIPVDYYVRMNFYAFMDVVDALNGVEVDVPFNMYEMDSNDQKNAIYLPEGRQSVDGEEALAFVRSRHMDSDIARGERQQEVIDAILDKAKSAGSINKYADVIDAVGDNMKTNMRFSEMRSFMSYAMNSNLSVDMHTLEGEGVMLDGVYYYEAYEEELEGVSEDLRQHLGLSSFVSNDDSSSLSDENSDFSETAQEDEDTEW